jgi:hypothetical protein
MHCMHAAHDMEGALAVLSAVVALDTPSSATKPQL